LKVRYLAVKRAELLREMDGWMGSLLQKALMKQRVGWMESLSDVQMPLRLADQTAMKSD